MPKKLGSVLIITIWTLMILTVMALGLARRTAIMLRVATFGRDRLKADYIARAGVKKAIWIIDNDIDDGTTDQRRLYQESWDPQGGGFKIGYLDEAGIFVHGLQDEENRLNINGIGNIINTEALFKRLLKEKNVAGASEIAEFMMDWTDADEEPDKPEYKNAPFVRPEEVPAALEYFYSSRGKNKGQARELAYQIYGEIKECVTVYGEKINVNSASKETLNVLILAAFGASGKGESEDNAQYLADKVVERVAQGPFEQQELNTFETGNANADQLWQYLKDNGVISVTSRYKRFTVTAAARGAGSDITVVYNKAEDPLNSKIVYWHEN